VATKANAKRNRKLNPPDRSEWITARESAALIGYNEAYIRRLANEGRVESQKVASALLVSRASLLAYKAAMDELGTKRFSKTRSERYPLRNKGVATQRAVKEAPSEMPYVANAELRVRSVFDLPFMSKEELSARNEAARALLRSWREETGEAAQDQIETGKLLMKSLSEDGLQFHTFPEWQDDEGDDPAEDDSLIDAGHTTESPRR